MPSWKKVVVSGSDATLNSLFVSNAVTASIFSGSFTGSLFGTASYVTGSVHTSANPALSASYAVTASYVLSSSYAFTASYVNTLTQNLIVSGTSLTLTPATTPSVSTFLLGDTTNGNQSSQILWRNYDFASKSTGFRIARISVGDGTTAYSTIDWTKAGSNSANINISVSQSLESVFSINGSNGFIGIRNSSPSYQLDVSGSANVTSALTVTGSVIATQAGFTGSLLGTASYVTGSIHTGANVAASSSFSFTASYVNPLRQDVIVSGSIYISASASNSSLLIGGNTTSSAENVLVVGIPSTGAGSGEGGQILLQAPNTSLYTSASMIDNYQNLMRILRGSNTGSDAVVTSFNLHSKQLQFPAYNGASAFVGTAVANLAVDSSGNVITVSTSGGTVFPYTGNAVITGSLLVSGASGAGSITASSAIVSLANNQMYFRGGDDAELWDVNERNTIAIVGQQDPGIGVIKLGSGSSGAYLVGRTGSLFTSGALYVSGGLGVTGSITVTLGGFTGSLLGTASYVTGSIFTGTNAALSASYAVTASYVTGSIHTSTNPALSASYALTSSYALNGGVTQIVAGTNISISPVSGLGAVTINGAASSAFPYTGSAQITGSLGITGSFSMGERVSSTGIYSTAIGSASLASGLGSLVIGQGVTASGYMSVIFADGAARFATASGDFSFVQGIAGDSNIHASGRGSFAQGDGTLASGQASHAQGQGSISSGSNSHAEGYYSFARGSWSHAEGNATQALGSYSHAEGDGSIASGSNSHAEGSSEARGVHSHSEGFALAIGQGSHAEGNSTSLGNFSHAEGDTTVSSGSYSHAEGVRTTARGNSSHAEGSGSLAVGLASHAEGLGTISSASYQHAQGQYNLTSSAQSAFIIGNGTSDASRSNLVFASGSQFQVTGSVISSAGFTGSLFGTASYVTGSIFTGSNAALSASYAVTASYALNAGGSATAFPYTGSAIISGSLTVVGDQVITGSVILSGSTSTELRVLGDQQVTGSLNVTGSFFATNIKAGTVTNTSFTSSPAGSPSSSAVTLSPPFSSNNYAVTVTGNDARVWDIDSKTATGFTINSNSTQALTGDTYWIAIGY